MVIELRDSSESEEDPDLERAIQLSLQPPGRPTNQPEIPAVERPIFRALYDEAPTPAKPPVPMRRVRPPPVMPEAPIHSESPAPSRPPMPSQVEMPVVSQPVRPPPPTTPKPHPPTPPPITHGLPMNPQIIVYPGAWPPATEPPNTATIEDVADLGGESRYTGEVVADAMGSSHESQPTDQWAGSSRDPRRITFNKGKEITGVNLDGWKPG